TWCPADGMADQTLVTRAYAGAAERLGARFLIGAPATGVTPGEPLGIEVESAEPLRAKRVVIAANVHAPGLVRHSFGVQLPVWTASLQVILATAQGGYRPTRLVGHLARTLSVKPLAGDITMISGGYHGRWDPDGEVGTPVPARVQENLDVAAAVLPGLAGVEVVSAETDRVDSFSHDGVPIIDEISAGVFVATGWTGHGFAIAPAVAASLAEWLVTGVRPAVLAPFGAGRFGRN
ncbi:MAG TPA: FAD-binding oxidoreductase, partial [Acidimicrobiia bacterium]|nr:FAD-binding oxidoreductase [Acidimicrobiia bacterium]